MTQDKPFRFPPMSDQPTIDAMLEDWGPYLAHPETDAMIPEGDEIGGLVEEGMYDAFMEGWQAGQRAALAGKIHTLDPKGMAAAAFTLAPYTPPGQMDQSISVAEGVVRAYLGQSGPVLRAFPVKPDENLLDALGVMVWNTGSMARILREEGTSQFMNIPRKAEYEQAFILHWLVGLVLEHGDGWRDVANKRVGHAQRVLEERKGRP